MKKAIIKTTLALAIGFPMLLTSCIEDAPYTYYVTADELGESSKATEALVWELPVIYNMYNSMNYSSVNHYDWGYGSLMHVRDVMGDDMAIVSSGYDWYSSWENNEYMGTDYRYPQFIWTILYKLVLSSNNALGAVGDAPTDEMQQGYAALAKACRASAYLDLARMYECLDATVDKGNYYTKLVRNLTVPIVTEQTVEADAYNNPRATREEMAEFILSDLDYAEQYISNVSRMSKTFPDLSVVYGLKARYYMWLGQTFVDTEDVSMYQKAAEYAQKAISASGATPLTRDQWLDPKTGFNTLATSSWLWGMQLVEEDRIVTSGILNWTSWVSNETSYGYAAAGPYLQIPSNYYQYISDTDFRKLSWVAPTSGALYQEQVIDNPDKYFINEDYYPTNSKSPLKEYYSLKFRPGQGNPDSYLVGSVVGIPLMRVEEMYFIWAEALAHVSPGSGKAKLDEFMKAYRDSNYTSPDVTALNFPVQVNGTVTAEIAEIIFQKRIELWGEGLNYFDTKRLNISVNRTQANSQWASARRYKTSGRPAWMNIVIVRSEVNSNKALVGLNNPDPSGMYTAN